jgi:1D-myo-inositol 3-kinase
LPRLLAIGHVTRDRRPASASQAGAPAAPGDVLGGSVTYGALAARRLGWDAAILTSAGSDFEPERELPGLPVFVHRSPLTTRFENEYDEDGGRRQVVAARADDVDLAPLPEAWRDPDVLLLGPVAGELFGIGALTFAADYVGAIAQGYVRTIRPDGLVATRAWQRPDRDLLGVHALFLSEQDLPDAETRTRELLASVPIVALTRGWRGLTLFTRDGRYEVPAFPRPEVDATGAGDVFAAAFLVRYQETGDALEAAAFGACAASCVVEGVGVSTLGDRAEVEKRLALRARLIEDGEWED